MNDLTRFQTLSIRYRDTNGSTWTRFTTPQKLDAEISELWADKAIIEDIIPAFSV